MKLRCKLFGHNHTEENEVCDTCGMHEYYDSKYHHESTESGIDLHYDNSALIMRHVWRLRNKLNDFIYHFKKTLSYEECCHCNKKSHELKWRAKKDRCPNCSEVRLPF